MFLSRFFCCICLYNWIYIYSWYSWDKWICFLKVEFSFTFWQQWKLYPTKRKFLFAHIKKLKDNLVKYKGSNNLQILHLFNLPRSNHAKFLRFWILFCYRSAWHLNIRNKLVVNSWMRRYRSNSLHLQQISQKFRVQILLLLLTVCLCYCDIHIFDTCL